MASQSAWCHFFEILAPGVAHTLAFLALAMWPIFSPLVVFLSFWEARWSKNQNWAHFVNPARLRSGFFLTLAAILRSLKVRRTHWTNLSAVTRPFLRTSVLSLPLRKTSNQSLNPEGTGGYFPWSLKMHVFLLANVYI